MVDYTKLIIAVSPSCPSIILIVSKAVLVHIIKVQTIDLTVIFKAGKKMLILVRNCEHKDIHPS